LIILQAVAAVQVQLPVTVVN